MNNEYMVQPRAIKLLVSYMVKALCVLLCCVSLQVSADNDIEFQDFHIKARYLTGFMVFVKWPQALIDSSKTLQLCVLGENPFKSTLDILVDAFNENSKKAFHVQKLVYLSRGADVSHCHLLYVSDFEEGYVSQILKQIEDKPVLTVSSLRNFISAGGMVQFYVKNDRVRFFIALKTLRNAGLQANANLLRIADIID